jgi:hypothetical protein
MPFLFVCQAAVPVQPAVVAAIGMVAFFARQMYDGERRQMAYSA